MCRCNDELQEAVLEYTNCKHAYGVPPTRSYGHNIPDNCQGCIFPGDEGYVACGCERSRGNECCADLCPLGPSFWHRRAQDSSIEEAARALFH